MKFFGYTAAAICLFAFPAYSEEKLTSQHLLPVPFSAMENVYFIPSPSKFLAFGPKEAFVEPIKAGLNRNYQFATTLQLPRVEARLEGTTLFLMEWKNTSNMVCHFFHLLEHIVGLWCFDGDERFAEVKLIVLAADGWYDAIAWRGPNDINQHLIKALFPNAEVKSWREFYEEHSKLCNNALAFDRVIFSDRAITRGSPACGRINKMLGEALPELDAKSLERMSERIHAYAETTIQQTTVLRVTYTKRHPPRTLTDDLEERLLTAICEIDNVELKVVDFAKISFKEQINLIGNTDVLLGVHGNGLSHSLFLPQEAAVIEMFPNQALALDYRLFANARGISYYGVVADMGLIDDKTAYHKGCFGDFSNTISNLDISLVISIIENLAGQKGPL